MEKDKYKALWLSHSSLKDFLNCPLSYYYRNMYKNPRTGRKVAIVKPALSLGQAVHSVIDELSLLKTNERFTIPLVDRFEKKWQSITGKKGGFVSDSEEAEYKKRGYEMIEMLARHPGPLLHKALKIKESLPFFWFSDKDNMILCGKIDWLEYMEDSDSVHIIDFKTGRVEEKSDSLQLPIYYLLATNTQNRKVTKLSYWYIDRKEKPDEMELPDLAESRTKIMKIAERIKLARQLNHFKCSRDEKDGCIFCAPLKAVVDGKGVFVGLGDYREELYILTDAAVSL